MTSPWSSPRMGIRSASRFSPATGPDYSTAVVASSDGGRRLIHPHCRLGDEDLSSRRLFVRRLFFGFLALVFGRVGQHWNGARILVQLQHRQHLEAFEIFDPHTEDHEMWLDSFDLRVRVLARFNEHDVVVPRLEY